MSYLLATPDFLSSAATDLASIGSSLNAANVAAAFTDDGGAGRRRR